MRSSIIRKSALFTAFFYLVCSVFLNSLSLARNSSYISGKESIHPLILSDYNSGTLYTNLGGLSGGDEETPGLTFASVTTDDYVTRGNSGYSLKLDYDVSRYGEYSFYWTKLGKEIGGKSGVTETVDLRSYNFLSFWIKGGQEEGNLKIELHQESNGDNIFTFGKDISSFVYLESYLKNGGITKEWKKAIIPLKDFAQITDWSKMIELVFVVENRAGNRIGTLYIDDILFGYRHESLISPSAGRELKEIKLPLEDSFRVNGLKAKDCLTFIGVNKLEIKAEEMHDNPLIEGVRFEYSTDKGNTWRTIDTDYDVSKNTYRVAWHPDNSRKLLKYQVRAVAADIMGNEKATAILIDCELKPISDNEFLDLIEKNAFDFFKTHQSMKTGLFADTTGGGDASIASTGFGLAALCIGAERGWISKEEAKARVLLALQTFLPQSVEEEPLAEGKYGFFYHFLNHNTAKRAGRSEISTVDTAILLCGALTAGEYFKGKVKEKAEELYRRVEWDKFLCKEKGPWYNNFSMGWSPERGFLGSYWDYYTDEVILISLLAIGSPRHPVSPDVFYAWTRHKGSYGRGDEQFIYSWHGSLFSYQYANAFFNFQNLVDKEGVNWFENSKNATLANRQFCIDNANRFKAYGPNSWGITSMARPEGYTMHFGTPPLGSGEEQYDGTISPTGPAGSIVFTPYLSISALRYMYATYPRLWGKYGLKDSFDVDLNWYAPTYYGIGVAMILLPIENFRSGLVWNNFMKNKHIKNALRKAGFTTIKKTKAERR